MKTVLAIIGCGRIANNAHLPALSQMENVRIKYACDIIPEKAAALKENGKYVECNAHFFRHPKSAEKFRHQYAEFLREMFEKGIPVTYGSDSHRNYRDLRQDLDPYLRAVGFSDGDFSEIAEEMLWS